MKIRKMKLKFLAIAVFFMLSNAAIGQNKLGIGDQAPAVKYSKWIKGEPVKSLDGDQLYILEFWATWCGPCKLAMPHLTKLQEEYKGIATFIGVGVLEQVPKDQPYETSLPAVEKFVKGNNTNMGYSVIADNNERFMANNWLKAAGENGIPSTFIVKNNKILWIGHPNSLDTVLLKIFNSTYDMAAFKASFERKADAGRKQAAEMVALFKPIEDAIKAKEFDKAFGLMDKLAAEKPDFKGLIPRMKFGTLLMEVSEEKAIEFVKEWQKEYKNAPALVLGDIYNKDKFAKSTYLWAAQNFIDSKIDPNTNPLILSALASCFAKGGDLKNAVFYQEKAVELAKKVAKDGSMVGTINNDTVVEYEEALADYRKQI